MTCEGDAFRLEELLGTHVKGEKLKIWKPLVSTDFQGKRS